MKSTLYGNTLTVKIVKCGMIFVYQSGIYIFLLLIVLMIQGCIVTGEYDPAKAVSIEYTPIVHFKKYSPLWKGGLIEAGGNKIVTVYAIRSISNMGPNAEDFVFRASNIFGFTVIKDGYQDRSDYSWQSSILFNMYRDATDYLVAENWSRSVSAGSSIYFTEPPLIPRIAVIQTFRPGYTLDNYAKGDFNYLAYDNTKGDSKPNQNAFMTLTLGAKAAYENWIDMETLNQKYRKK